MIGRAGSMIGSGGAFASQPSRGGKIRPNWVLVCVALIDASPVAYRDPITAWSGTHPQAAGEPRLAQENDPLGKSNTDRAINIRSKVIGS